MPLRFKKRNRGGMPYTTVRGAKVLLARKPASQSRPLERETLPMIGNVKGQDTRGRKS